MLYANFLDIQKKELLEKTFFELTFPDDIPDSKKNIEDLKLRKRNHFTIEKRYIHKSGKVIWGFTSVTAIYNNKKNIEYFIAECQDITSRKHAEEELSNAYATMEQKVLNRTEKIDKEIEERKKVETELRAIEEKYHILINHLTD